MSQPLLHEDVCFMKAVKKNFLNQMTMQKQVTSLMLMCLTPWKLEETKKFPFCLQNKKADIGKFTENMRCIKPKNYTPLIKFYVNGVIRKTIQMNRDI